jgi:hypothetical protein
VAENREVNQNDVMAASPAREDRVGRHRGDAFIAELGIDAYSKARGLQRDAATCERTSHWARVAQTIARKMRKGVGLDAAAYMRKDSGSSTALKTRGDLPRAHPRQTSNRHECA